MNATIRVDLSGGASVSLRAVGADDDAFVLDTAEAMLPAPRANALIARCMVGRAVPADALTVGDREAILLHLRRLTFGDSMACLLPCPNPSCGEQLQVSVDVSDLLVPRAESTTGRVRVDSAGATFDVSFRLPTAADLDATAADAVGDPDDAALALLARSLLHADRDGEAVDAQDLPEEVRAAVAAAMAERDPQAEVSMTMRCPECGRQFSSLFDAAAFLLRELEARAARTLREVHVLAQHYHWSEADILRMPAQRRARYIELIHESRGRRRISQ